ncbi:MAG: hypothetical protein HYS13_06580 [Planctomycetia bacterium]|nr:hypothetical protein [Planctomycetia bacterium]
MLLPRFTLRKLLALVAAASGVCAIVALGVSGTPWAAAVSVGLLAIVVPFAAYLALFGVVWVFSVLTQSVKPDPADFSPFRSETPELAKAYGRHLPREALGVAGGVLQPWPEGMPLPNPIATAPKDGAAASGTALPSADGHAVADAAIAPSTPPAAKSPSV